MNAPDRLERLDRLSPAKRALIERRLRSAAASPDLPTTIPRRPASDVAELSFAQQRLWFLQQLAPDSPAYNEALLIQIRGDLQIDALSRALSGVIGRHDVLRSTYHGSGTEVYQVIHDPDVMPPALAELDLTDAPEADRRALAWAQHESRRAFDLSTGPLVRTTLLRTGDRRFLLVQASHHIVSDGWSLRVLVREVAQLYRAACEGRPSPLPELPLQYADYAHWHRRWLDGGVLERQLEYWRTTLHGLPPAMPLPGNRPRSPETGRHVITTDVLVPSELKACLLQLCRQERVTLFTALLACFNILLHRYTGQHDLVVGTPTSGRTRPELEQLIGFFVNMLAVRVEIAGSLTFRQVLARVHEAAMGALEHQDVPFDRVVDALQPRRSLHHAPVFQVMFALESFREVQEEKLPGLHTILSVIDSGTPKYDLTLIVRESHAELHGLIEADAALFTQDLIQNLAQHYVNLLRESVGHPDRAIGDLAMLSPAERRLIVVDWNAQRPSRRGQHGASEPVHRRFERGVARHPHAIAIEADGTCLTYAELNVRANRLAHGLRARGVEPGRGVLVRTRRSVDSITAMLAVWKAGAVYVPFDPDAPTLRLQSVLEDVAPALVLAPPFDPLLADSTHDLDDTDRPPHSPAYIIFTSGTTGVPKGIAVSHHAFAHHCAEISDTYELSPSDRVLQFAEPYFDVALEQTMPPLLAGARVVVRPDEPPDAELFLSRLAALGVTVVDLPTAFWREIVRHSAIRGAPVACPMLRLVIVGGEAMQPGDAVLAATVQAPARLVNAYGPTEATITATVYEVPASLDGPMVPIGRPIGTRLAIILDAYGNPVPPGARGELHLGGSGLANGYLNQPELTATRFVRNRLAPALPGTRLLRTGDLAQYRSDGAIELLGRADDQVKVRGYRVELGEIEAVLRQHPAVDDVAVVFDDGKLVAHVAAASATGLDPAGLRAFLRQRVPDYMVPASFNRVAALPLTPGGKIDRGSLREQVASGGMVEVSRTHPRTQTEVLLAQVWADVLDVEEPSVDADFFELGGHSLLATRLIVRAREAFACDIPLRWLFESPTIGELAARIDSLTRANPLPPVERVPRGQPLPLTISQAQLWAADRARPGAPFFTMLTAVRLGGALDATALTESFGALIRRHEALRTTFQVRDGQPVQVINAPWPFTLEVFDLSDFSPTDRANATAYLQVEFARHRFDLERGPLLRAGLISVGSDEHVVLLAVHHIVADGWSLDILADEVERLYPAFADGREPVLPDLPLQFADFAAWQTRVVAGGQLDTQLTFWRQALRGPLVPLCLPADRPRPTTRTFRYGKQRIQLAASLAAAIDALAAQQGATDFMVAFAGFIALLTGYGNRADIRIGTIGANRHTRAVEGVVGLLMNTLVLRTDVTGDPSFTELLRRVRRATLEAFDHQELPFEHLRDALSANSAHGPEPLFQILFLYQRQRSTTVGLRGADVLGALPDATPLDVHFSTLDWIVEVERGAAGLTVTIKHDADVYNAGTLQAALTRFAAVLDTAVREPGARISDIVSGTRDDG